MFFNVVIAFSSLFQRISKPQPMVAMAIPKITIAVMTMICFIDVPPLPMSISLSQQGEQHFLLFDKIRYIDKVDQNQHTFITTGKYIRSLIISSFFF